MGSIGTLDLEALPPVRLVTMPDAGRVNKPLAAAYEQTKHGPGVRRTHHFHGRFENTYLDQDTLPQIRPVIDFALEAAARYLGTNQLHFGFWFNDMQPGHRTSLHDHSELDELLSAVYYIRAPQRSGRLILRHPPCDIFVTPHPGLLVLFPPDTPHEVETNESDDVRLSVAFNFGPPDAAN